MGIRRRLNQLFRRNTVKTTADETRQAVGHSADYMTLAEMFREEQDRLAIIRTCRTMYKDDPRARKIIQTLARDATKGGYQLEFADDGEGTKEATEMAEALRDRLRLNKRIDDWARLTFRDGDSFLELGVAADNMIEEINRLPALDTHRYSNEQDKFDDPAAAYWHSRNSVIGSQPPRDALWFAEWQIVHVRWDHDEGSRYGTPLMASARGSWKRLKEGELDISIRRKTRAGMKYAHILKNADEATIAAYRKINEAALNNPFAAALDFFMNGEGDIKSIGGDANLGQIADVQHHINTFWLASPVPESIAGVGNMIDFSVVGHQAAQYAETLDQVQEWVADQIVSPILETQWLLMGILPERLKYRITWPTKKQSTPDDILKVVQAAAQMRALGFPQEAIIALVLRYLPGVTRDMLDDLVEPNSQQMPDRMGQIMATMMARLGNRQTADTSEPDEDEDEETTEESARTRLNGYNGHGRVRVPTDMWR